MCRCQTAASRKRKANRNVLKVFEWKWKGQKPSHAWDNALERAPRTLGISVRTLQTAMDGNVYLLKVPQPKPWGSSNTGWNINVCNRFPTLAQHCHTHVLPATRQLQSDYGDFSDGVCHVMEITITESSPVIRLFITRTLHKYSAMSLILWREPIGCQQWQCR